jgi:hypothetical protein
MFENFGSMSLLCQSSSFNHWIKLKFDSKWTLNFKMLSYTFKFFFFIFKVSKKCHQDFSLLDTYHIFWWKKVKSGSPIVCFHPHTWCDGTYLCKDATSVSVCPFLLTLEWRLKSFDHPGLATKNFQSNCNINGRGQSTIDRTNRNLFQSLQNK